MPAADAPLRGAARRPPPKRRPPPRVAQAKAQARGYASQGRQVAHAAARQQSQARQRQRAARKTFTPIPKLGPSPGHARARQLDKRVERAERRQRGSLPLPALPSIRYTPRQRQAALDLVRHSIAGARRRGETSESIARAARHDPVVRATLQRAVNLQRTQQRQLDARLAARTLTGKVRLPIVAPTGGVGMLRPEGSRMARQVEGATQAQLAAVGRDIRRGITAQAKPGKKHERVGFGAASIDTTAAGRAVNRAVLGNLTTGHGAVLRNLPDVVKNAAGDAYAFPVGAIKGVAMLGQAVGEGVAQGAKDPRHYLDLTPTQRKLVEGFKAGALGQLAQGHPGKAAEAFKAHPLFSLLDVAGVTGAISRTAGLGVRSAAGTRATRVAGRGSGVTAKVARRVDQLGDVNRPGLEIAPGQVVERRYSKSLGRAALQRRQDAKRGRNAAGNVVAPESIVPFRGARHQRSEAVDEFAAYRQGVARTNREGLRRDLGRTVPVRKGAGKTGRRAGVQRAVDRAKGSPVLTAGGRAVAPRAERQVVHMAVENRISTATRGAFEDSLRREYTRLENIAHHDKTLSHDTLIQNRMQRAEILHVLKDPKALDNFKEVRRAAEEYKALGEPIREGLEGEGVIDPEQAQHAAERPFAVTQMNARYRTDRAMPEERYQQARHEARQAGRDATLARQRVNRARHALGREEERARAAGKAPAEWPGYVRARGRLDAARVDARQVAKAANAAKRAAGKAKPRSTSGLVADGEHLHLSQIQAERARRGLPKPGFVTHRRDTRGARSFFVNWFDSRKSEQTSSNVRTGEASRTGGHAISEAALHESLIRSRGVLDAVRGFDAFVKDFAVKRDGQMMTPGEAERMMGEIEAAGGPRMAPIRALQASLPEHVRKAIAEGQDVPDLGAELVKRIDDARVDLASTTSGARNIVLVPEDQLARFAEHQKLGTGAGGKVAQKLTNVFRGTVLSTSTKWLTGNVVEATVRSLISQGPAVPLNMLQGKRIMRALESSDAVAAEAFRARVLQGLLYGSRDRLSIHRDASALAGTELEPIGAGIGAVARAPAVKQVLGGIDHYQALVFGLNKGLERAYIYGVIGKAARDDAMALGHAWHKTLGMQKGALEDTVAGLTGSARQIRYARQVDAVLGKYTRFSPSVRRITQTMAPFLPWYLNSVRFVTHTLPVDHPVLTALLTNAERTFYQDWEDQIDKTGSGELIRKGNLKAGLILKSGGILSVDRYTPFGAFTGDLAGAATDPLFPQVASLWEIAHGRNWAGRELDVGQKRGEPVGGKGWLALYAALESILPGLQVGRRLREHGETAYDNSTIFKPHTKAGTAYTGVGTDNPGFLQAANRVFNPLRPTYLKPPKRGGGGAAAVVGAAKGIDPAMLREARRAARQAAPSRREQDALLREARAAAGLAP